MEHDQAVKLVQDAVREHLCTSPDAYTLETSLSQLGADSLDFVSICLLIEDKIGKEIKNVHVEQYKTIGDLVSLLELRY